MRKAYFLLGLLLLGLNVSAQTELRLNRNSKDPLSVDRIQAAGIFSATGYENTTLGFSITAPVGFKKVSSEANSAALQTGKEIIKDAKSGASSQQIERSVAGTRVLFQYHGGGASLAAGVENVPTGTTSRNYADANVSILRSISHVKVVGQVREWTLGGRPFQLFEVELNKDGGTVSQLFMVHVQGNVALFLIASIGDPALEEALTKSLNSLKFK